MVRGGGLRIAHLKASVYVREGRGEGRSGVGAVHTPADTDTKTPRSGWFASSPSALSLADWSVNTNKRLWDQATPSF